MPHAFIAFIATNTSLHHYQPLILATMTFYTAFNTLEMKT
jgi:hypothetical protein